MKGDKQPKSPASPPCGDGYLQMQHGHRRLVCTEDVTNVTEKPNVSFYLIFVTLNPNLNNHRWLAATASDDTEKNELRSETTNITKELVSSRGLG